MGSPKLPGLTMAAREGDKGAEDDPWAAVFSDTAVRCRRPGRLPEWPKGADCKSAGSAYVGSNPTPATVRRPVSVETGRRGCGDYGCRQPLRKVMARIPRQPATTVAATTRGLVVRRPANAPSPPPAANEPMLPALKADPIDPAEAIEPIEPADPTERADPTQLTEPMEKALLREAMLKIEFSDQRDQVLEGQFRAIYLPCQVRAGPATGLIRFLRDHRSRVT